MKKLVLILLTCFLRQQAGAAQAQSQVWDVEEIVPEVQIIGQATDAHRAGAVAMRQRLVEQMTYWQARGLTQSPPR